MRFVLPLHSMYLVSLPLVYLIGMAEANTPFPPPDSDSHDFHSHSRRPPYFVTSTLLPTTPAGIMDHIYLCDQRNFTASLTKRSHLKDIKIGDWYSYDMVHLGSYPKTRNITLTLRESTLGTNVEATETIMSYDPCRGVSVFSTIRFPSISAGRSPVLGMRTSFMPEGSFETRMVISATVEPAIISTSTPFHKPAILAELEPYAHDFIDFLRLEISTNKEKYLKTDSRVSQECAKRVSTSFATPETPKQVFEELKDLMNSLNDLSRDMAWIEEKTLATEARVAHLEAENDYLWRALKGGKVWLTTG